MSYLWGLWTSGLQYYIIILLIVVVFAIQKDRYDATGTIFDGQRWTLYDFLLWAIIFTIYSILIQYLTQWPLLKKTAFWTLNFCSIYAIFKYRIRQNFVALGLFKKDLLLNILHGIRIILVVDFFLLGMLFLTPDPGEHIKGIHRAYTSWTLYQGSLPIIIYLISLFIIIAPFTEELMRGLMYSPFRKKIGKWGGILITTVIFALCHGHWFSPAMLVLAYIYEKRQSLVSSIAAHSFFNMSRVALFIYTADLFNIGYNVTYKSYLGLTLLIYLAVFIVISIILGVKQKREVSMGY